MKTALTRFRRIYLDPALDLRVRLFNVLAIGGLVISLLMGILSVVNNGGTFIVAVNLAAAALSFGLLIYSRRTGRYQICYMITIAVIFLGFFPALFFGSGGYHSGMPAFFVFAVVFTVFMLEGKKAVIFSVTELVLYITICIIAYLYPDTVRFFSTERELLNDILIAFTTVSVVLGVSMFFHFRLYNEQQRKLDQQNDLLTKTNSAKTEFLANASHDMRTPLTVISVNVQTALGILEDMGDASKDPDMEKLLQNAQGEIMRLARMVGGMLTLASMSENTDKSVINFSSLLQSGADMLRLYLHKRGNVLKTQIEPGLRVFGNADLLAQMVSNLLQNAGTHTENGAISLRAAKSGAIITVTVRDNGTGIKPELLPRVFERGASDGGTGFGLYLCKTVVESHSGRIWIESEPGKGTAVFFTVSFYEGQYGGDAA